MEANFENYLAVDVNKLFDGDSDTCEALQNYWTYLPMTTIRTAKQGPANFTVTVNVKNEVQATAQLTTSVFISHGELTNGDYYRAQETFNICSGNGSLTFGCYCPFSCNVYIRFRFDKMQDAEGLTYEVCEIEFA